MGGILRQGTTPQHCGVLAAELCGMLRSLLWDWRCLGLLCVLLLGKPVVR